MVTFAGHTNAGGVKSSFVIVCVHVPEFPQSSVTTHVRVIIMFCGQLPETCESEKVTVKLTSQLSVPVADPVFDGFVLALQAIVTLGGHDAKGAIASSKVRI